MREHALDRELAGSSDKLRAPTTPIGALEVRGFYLVTLLADKVRFQRRDGQSSDPRTEVLKYALARL